jgi:hypothetical protein
MTTELVVLTLVAFVVYTASVIAPRRAHESVVIDVADMVRLPALVVFGVALFTLLARWPR